MIKKIFFIFSFAFISLSFSANQALAQIIDDPVAGLNATAGEVNAFTEQMASYDQNPNFLATKAGTIISLILSFVGVLFLILMIYAGILWMTASGNDQQISKAKSLLINAVIGIIVVLSAYALTTFIGDYLL
jgi:hypothetical protein